MTVTMQETMETIRKYAPNFFPEIGIILGSGLGSIAEQLTQPVTIPYQAIPGLKTGGVTGHASLLIMGYLNEIPVVCMKGRLHLYEGTSLDSLKTFIRIIKSLGAESLIVTAASGSLREDVGPGEMMLLTDHINFQPFNALVGANDETVGPRFVGMENAYDEELRIIVSRVAERMGFALPEGVYVSVVGPSFETPAEIRAFRTLGADAVGMSVVQEVILARHCGLRVLGLSAITNFASGMQHEKLTHEGTLHFGEIAARKLGKLIPEFIREYHRGRVF
ncbi:MAG TPA: purine-nucleoside phosphorylase [Gammaproteobacteria bacterium]|nr:purine-nucleoside phosphorylase [Gammaproteobacteria bacterium]